MTLLGNKNKLRRNHKLKAFLHADFHREGVRVLLPYNPWDQHTRPPTLEDPQQLIAHIVATDSDGFNGDTMDGVGVAFWEAGLDQAHPVVMEPEGLRSSWAPLEYNLMSWAYWTPGALVWDILDKQGI
jgi:iron(II)-dependent oxidoreductase